MAQPTTPAGDEADLDAVIDKIDACLPAIHERAKQNGSATPAQGFSPENFRRTKAEFAAMSEDSLLSDSREDIVLSGENGAEKNGKVIPLPQPQPERSRVLRFRRRST